MAAKSSAKSLFQRRLGGPRVPRRCGMPLNCICSVYELEPCVVLCGFRWLSDTFDQSNNSANIIDKKRASKQVHQWKHLAAGFAVFPGRLSDIPCVKKTNDKFSPLVSSLLSLSARSGQCCGGRNWYPSGTLKLFLSFPSQAISPFTTRLVAQACHLCSSSLTFLATPSGPSPSSRGAVT